MKDKKQKLSIESERSLKNHLKTLRNSLASKSYGTEIKVLKNGSFIVIKTTKPTGFFSKKQVKAFFELDKAFFNLPMFQQQRILIEALKKRIN